MKWNWQQKNWPYFKWNNSKIIKYENEFLKQYGVQVGVSKHLSNLDNSHFIIELMTNEAVITSEIEGEYLDRDSVKSSLRKYFGLSQDYCRVKPSEKGISDLMTDLYQNYNEPLSHNMLHNWHKMIMNGRYDLENIGSYRAHEDVMQVVSGRLDKTEIHFEAPPSKNMDREMGDFIEWWQRTLPRKKDALSPLTRAGIAHLYFVCIHPYEDGNGRLARAIVEKSLSEYQDQPALLALSQTINKKRKLYYDKLEQNNKTLEITDWLVYFAQTTLEAQQYTIKSIDFLLEKTKLFDKVRGQLNARQEKIIERMFREGIEGFKGGLSAENYIRITDTSRATATRDLQNLVDKCVLIKKGQLKATRYYLNIG